jgi:hypothetical protein
MPFFIHSEFTIIYSEFETQSLILKKTNKMIYITYKHSSFSNGTFINNVWESPYKDLEIAYRTFLREKSDELSIVINPHWGNIMNHEDHHKHLSKIEYKSKVKEWNKFIKIWNFDKFIIEHGKGVKVNYVDIVR